MSLTEQTPRTDAILSTDTDQIPFTYPFEDDSELYVVSDGRGVLTLTTDYITSGAGEDDGGFIEMVGGIPTEKITILRVTPQSQLLVLRTNGRYFITDIAYSLDKLTKMTQEAHEILARCIKTSVSDGSVFVLPDATDRELKTLAFDASGDLELITRTDTTGLDAAIAECEAQAESAAVSSAAALVSENNAATSEANAATSEANAAQSAIDAENSASSVDKITAIIPTSQSIPSNDAVTKQFANKLAGRAALAALPAFGAYPISLTEAEYDALTEYAPRTYNIIDTGDVYQEAVCVRRAPWKYGPTDLHVTKSGNDTTGDGSFGLPYLTISKAYNEAVLANGGLVWVHEGTYAENSGSGYWQPSDAPTARVTVRGRPDQQVVLTNVSGAYVVRPLFDSTNITLRGLRIEAANSGTALFILSGGTSVMTNWDIVECDFNDVHGINTSIQIAGGPSSNVGIKRCTIRGMGRMSSLLSTVADLSVVGCNFTSTNAGSTISVRLGAGVSGVVNVNNNYIYLPNATTTSQGIYNDFAITSSGTHFNIRKNRLNVARNGLFITGGAVGSHITMNLDDNYIIAGQSGLRVEGGVSGGTCDRNYVDSLGTIAFGYPTDSSNVELVDGVTMQYNEIHSRAPVGHGFLIGQNSQNIVAEHNFCDASKGGYFGLVMKGTNNTARYSEFYGGNQNSIYLKGANGCVVEDCVAHQTVDTNLSSGAIGFAAGIDAEPLVDNTIRNCIVYLTIGELYDFAGSDLSTGNVIDGNTYILTGTATYGTMFGSAVASLDEVKASWAANYGVDTNDSDSFDQ